jgi:hypothetical protein
VGSLLTANLKKNLKQTPEHLARIFHDLQSQQAIGESSVLNFVILAGHHPTTKASSLAPNGRVLPVCSNM